MIKAIKGLIQPSILKIVHTNNLRKRIAYFYDESYESFDINIYFYEAVYEASKIKIIN